MTNNCARGSGAPECLRSEGIGISRAGATTNDEMTQSDRGSTVLALGIKASAVHRVGCTVRRRYPKDSSSTAAVVACGRSSQVT